MAQRLHGEEHAVQGERHDDHEELVQGRERSARRLGVVGQDQADHRQRQDHGEKRVRALQVVALLVVAQAAEQQREAGHAVEHDHDDREHGVAREERHRRAGEHHRGDHHHLDGGDGEGQDQRAVGLAHHRRQDFGVVHHREGRYQDHHEQPGEGERRP
jgi:hypothetical protein